jgi:hypothetical protein
MRERLALGGGETPPQQPARTPAFLYQMST